MPRSARIVLPDVPHHITQRGNRRQPVFFSDDDYRAYIDILGIALRKHDTKCLAWCLMPNHVHLMLVPSSSDGLRGTLSSAHTAYAQRVNRLQNISGHLFQGRFASYPMDDAHMMVAARYIELNPVKAGLTRIAEDWAWSSARAHIGGQADAITDLAPLSRYIKNWRAMLVGGLEAADAVEAALRSGQPLASPKWMDERGMKPSKPLRGRPPANSNCSQLSDG